MSLFLQLIALLWAAAVLGAEGGRPDADNSSAGPLVAAVAGALIILLIVSLTGPPLGHLVIALVLMAHAIIVGVVWLIDHAMVGRGGARDRHRVHADGVKNRGV